jgi:hypothetical protein
VLANRKYSAWVGRELIDTCNVSANGICIQRCSHRLTLKALWPRANTPTALWLLNHDNSAWANKICLQRFGHKLTLNTFWPIINPCNTNSTWAGNIHIQRFSQYNSHTALKTLQALWPRAYAPTAIWPIVYAYSASLGQSTCSVYLWPKRCVHIPLARLL